MIKQDLINQICARTGVDRVACSVVIDESIALVRKTLWKGEPIYLRGLFTLKPILREEKKARVITRNQQIIVPAHYVPHAKFSKEIIEKMKKNLPVKK